MATSLALVDDNDALQVMLTSGRMWVESITVWVDASPLISERTSWI